jgi:NAD(P)-dependent dehydrogenase (short-subunit alcohol dehydrogenase family)
MGNRLEGKKALVTGAGSGIGRATAVRFAEEGADIVVADLIAESAESTTAEVGRLGRKAFTCAVDVSEEAQVERMVQQAVRDLGNIDILFHAAGILTARYRSGTVSTDFLENVVDKQYADWQRVLSVNLGGTFLVDRAVARAMIAAGKGGKIVNIASMQAKWAAPGVSDYSAAKAGVWMLSRILAMELAPHGIRVNAIAPGIIDTPMTAGVKLLEDRQISQITQSIPLKRWGEPRDVANAALFLVSDESDYFTAEILNVDGGLMNGY